MSDGAGEAVRNEWLLADRYRHALEVRQQGDEAVALGAGWGGPPGCTSWRCLVPWEAPSLTSRRATT